MVTSTGGTFSMSGAGITNAGIAMPGATSITIPTSGNHNFTVSGNGQAGAGTFTFTCRVGGATGASFQTQLNAGIAHAQAGFVADASFEFFRIASQLPPTTPIDNPPAPRGCPRCPEIEARLRAAEQRVVEAEAAEKEQREELERATERAKAAQEARAEARRQAIPELRDLEADANRLDELVRDFREQLKNPNLGPGEKQLLEAGVARAEAERRENNANQFRLQQEADKDPRVQRAERERQLAFDRVEIESRGVDRAESEANNARAERDSIKAELERARAESQSAERVAPLPAPPAASAAARRAAMRSALEASLEKQDALAMDGRPTRPTGGPSRLRFDIADFYELAQRPDGSNPLRDAMAGKWNVWGEGRLTGVRDRLANSNSAGFVGAVGFDYRFAPWITGGLSGAVESFETRLGAPSTRIGTIGLSLAPYANVRLDPNVTATLFGAISSLSYDSNPAAGVSARFAAVRFLMGGAVTGQWQEGPWRFQPSVSLSYGTEQQQSYVDSAGTRVPEQTVNFGTIAAGPEIGYRFKSADGAWDIEPFATSRLNINYVNSSTAVFNNGVQVATRGNVSGSLGGGLSVQSRDGLSARL